MARIFNQSIRVKNGTIGLSSVEGNGFQATLVVEQWYHPLAADVDYYLDGSALGNGAATTPTPLKLAPDFPRNVTVVASAAATSVVTVTGTRLGDAVHEHLTLNGATEVVGSQIFDTITSIGAAARIDGAATIDVGLGSKLGTSRALIDFAVEGLTDGAVEAAPTKSVTNSSLIFNTALAPTKVYTAKYWSSELK
jgi:hypothetical protein